MEKFSANPAPTDLTQTTKPSKWCRIAEVASFVGTYPFRTAVRTEPGGEVIVAPLLDACQTEGEIDLAVPRITNPNQKYDRYFLAVGDVLIQARGRHVAGIVQLQDQVIAAPGLYALRPISHRITPDYLAWCLNHPKTQATLAEVAQGTHSPFIAKQTLIELRIPVPPIDVQQRIADVMRALEHERELVQQRAIAQQNLLNGKAWEVAVEHAQELP